MDLNEKEIKENNTRILNSLSHFLWNTPKAISKEEVDKISNFGITKKLGFSLLIASYLGIDMKMEKDKKLFYDYFPKMISLLNIDDYQSNPFIKNIIFQNASFQDWELNHDSYSPYECFVKDDFLMETDGKIIPQIGYFESEFSYPAIYQNNSLWMSVTPNEVNTMKKPLEEITGKICVMGLGMGYFAYMASIKKDVSNVDVVEISKSCIQLFEQVILSQFKDKEKVKVINNDAFKYLEEINDGDYDYIYIDLWKDVSDGLPLYQKLKKINAKLKKTKVFYWIEDTMKCYL